MSSGLASQVGVSAESTYGTYVAPTKFLRARSYSIERVANRVQGEGIQSGVTGPLASQFVESTNAATASLSMDVQTTRMGVLLATLMGGSTVSQQGTTTAYLQTFTLADTLGDSLTMQLAAPYRGGSSVAHTLTGGKVASAAFSCDATGILGVDFSVDGRAFTTTQTLATASYVTSAPFHGGQMAVKLGTFGSESAVSGVRSVSLTIDRPHDTEDYTAGASGLKAEPVLNGPANITGSITADWLNKATFQDLAHGTSGTSLVWEFTGATIAAANAFTFRITLPGCSFDSATQGVGGPDALQQTWPFTWRYDGTNLPVITYMTTDTAV